MLLLPPHLSPMCLVLLFLLPCPPFPLHHSLYLCPATASATAPLHLRHASSFTPALYSRSAARRGIDFGAEEEEQLLHTDWSKNGRSRDQMWATSRGGGRNGGYASGWKRVNRAKTAAAADGDNIIDHEETTTTAEVSLKKKTIRYETMYFTQTLDHFSFVPVSDTKFQQRYLLSTEHWGGAAVLAPIFVYCGNEGDIEWFAQNTGFLWELAPIYHAMVVFPEHRYYGQSIPGLAAINRTSETLGYLTAEQALADYAILISDLKRNYSAEDCPVVAFGGSYGGMLAAWFRLKYPHIVIGALASSAPILEFDNLVPTDGFYRTVSEDFKNASTSCFETIKASWDALEAAYEVEGGMQKVSKLFNFCDNNTLDLSSAQDFLFAAWVYMAMTDYPYAANFLEPMPGNPVNVACHAIDSFPNGTDILTRVAAGVNVYYNGTGQVQCFNNSADSDTHGMSLWGWQFCTEMVMPLNSNPDNSMFPATNFSYEGVTEECVQEFGVTPRPHWITQEFGGHNIRSVLKRFGSNIVFSNGRLDPWSTAGVLEDISKTVVALVTPKGAHHLDLRASTSSDPGWLRRQRREERKHISRWLRKYYSDLNS